MQQNERKTLGEQLLDQLKKLVTPNPNAEDPYRFRFDWQRSGYSITPTSK